MLDEISILVQNWPKLQLFEDLPQNFIFMYVLQKKTVSSSEFTFPVNVHVFEHAYLSTPTITLNSRTNTDASFRQLINVYF